ncbi:MAG: RNA degradosome polyphosphate kinase, partial [Planctomycetota bacterium]|nr:RNA degradosome polyphosphate kinase [Planctomycetota bacterium]
RGICCLRPGVPGVSENIRVISIVDKFLEHARITYFENGGAPEVFLASADWMPRNFRRRVEIMFPIEDPRLRHRIIESILGVALLDNVKAREMRPDGGYRRVVPKPGAALIRSQVEFQNMARELSVAAPIRNANSSSSAAMGRSI